jgi:hypothetical protein
LCAGDDRCFPRIQPGDGTGLRVGEHNQLRLDLEEDVLIVGPGAGTAVSRRRRRTPSTGPSSAEAGAEAGPASTDPHPGPTCL